MIKITYLSVFFLVFWIGHAQAQTPMMLCQDVTTNGTTTCQPISSANPLQITGGSSGSGTVNIGSTGQIAAYLANGTTVSPTNNIDLNNGGVTVGTGAVGNAPGLNGLYVQGATSIGSPAHASLFNVSGGVSIGTDYVILPAPTNGAIIEGNVGIGTATAQNVLDVNLGSSGDVRFRNGSSAGDGYIASANGTYINMVNTSYNGANFIAQTSNRAAMLSLLGGAVGSASIATAPTTTAGSAANFTTYFNLANNGHVCINCGGNSGNDFLDVEGSASIGYSGTLPTAPTNGLLVNGNTSIGTTSANTTLTVNGGYSSRRVTVSNASYTILATDQIVAYTALSTSQVVSVACTFGSTLNPQLFEITDESGGAGTLVTLSVTPTSGTIDGTTTKVGVNASHGVYKFYSNGTNCFSG